MDVLYIPQLDDGDGTGVDALSGRYRILKRVPEAGTVLLTDRAVTRIEVTGGEPLRLIIPPEVKGASRDFFARLVVTADEVPEVTFAAPDGETVSFEDADVDALMCEIGVNTFAFTETDAGVFLVNRKAVDIEQEVKFDPCGGESDVTSRSYRLGAAYLSLPKPTRDGYSFVGWFTAAQGGVEVSVADRCKTGVTRLYAHWEVYADPFAAVICRAGNLSFRSEGDAPWTVDAATCASAPGSARSGAIDHNKETSLVTHVTGRGVLSFKWKVSSEDEYDELTLYVDGARIARISGNVDWIAKSHTITADGAHTVVWTYEKDGSVSQRSDCGWVDDVSWTPEG